jgi:hypothetical protein
MISMDYFVKFVTVGTNSTNMSYNASATSSLVRFENKNIFFVKKRSSLL